MNVPHYFIAVPLPTSVKAKLGEWQDTLKEKLPFKIWPHLDDLHITLKFLGPVGEKQLNTVLASLKSIETVQAFSLQVGGLGFFGAPDKPRVLWADVEKKDELFNMRQTIEQLTVQVGFERDKRTYSPHITLAKRWQGGREDLSEFKKQYRQQEVFLADQVVIYQIFPGRQPKYHVIAAFGLRGGSSEWHSS